MMAATAAATTAIEGVRREVRVTVHVTNVSANSDSPRTSRMVPISVSFPTPRHTRHLVGQGVEEAMAADPQGTGTLGRVVRVVRVSAVHVCVCVCVGMCMWEVFCSLRCIEVAVDVATPCTTGSS